MSGTPTIQYQKGGQGQVDIYRFRYLRAPHGYLASGDGFTHRDSITSKDVKNKVTLVDDNLVWDQ